MLQGQLSVHWEVRSRRLNQREILSSAQGYYEVTARKMKTIETMFGRILEALCPGRKVLLLLVFPNCDSSTLPHSYSPEVY